MPKKLAKIITPLTSTTIKSTIEETASQSLEENNTEQTLASSDIPLFASTTDFLTSHQQTLSFVTGTNPQSNLSAQPEETKTTMKRKDPDELQETITQEPKQPANKRQNIFP